MPGNGNGNGQNITVITGGDGDNFLDSSSEINGLRINGGDGNDTILAGFGADRVNAGDGDDLVNGGAGDDTLFGNDGYDTAQYNGSVLEFLWANGAGNSITIQDIIAGNGDDGTDTLKHFEALSFDDYVFVVAGPNAALVQAPNATTDEDNSVDVTIDAYDFDGGTVALDSFLVSGDHASDASATLLLNGATPIAQGMGVGATYQLTFSPGTAYQYLAAGEAVEETLTFTVSDGQGNVTIETATLTIEGVNDPPVITGVTYDSSAVVEDGVQTASGSVQATDIDATDVLTFSAAAGGVGTYGTLTMDPGGTWIYTLDNASIAVQSLAVGVTMTETISVSVDDGNGGTASTVIEIDVTGTNDAPEFNPVVYNQTSVTEDLSLTATGNVSATDIDVGDSLSYAIQGSANGTYGSIQLDAAGNWIYTLNNDSEIVQNLDANETVTDSFIFEVSDGNGGNDTISVSVDIHGAEDIIAPPASTLSFEGFSQFPLGYGGVTWSAGWRAVDPSDLGGGRGGSIDSGYANGLTSGDQVAYNANGNDVELLGTDFDLESVYLTAAWRNGLTIEVSGYDDGVLVGTETFVVDWTGPTFVAFDDAIFDNVDRVVFHASGGVNPGLLGDGTHFVMDDLTLLL